MRSCLTAQISASALKANVALLRKLLFPPTRICAAVKADCYGHGQALLAGTLAGMVDCLGVATPEEAIALRQTGYKGPILMFFSLGVVGHGKEGRNALRDLIAGRISLTITSPDEVPMIGKAAGRLGIQTPVHVKVDSGMGRSGVLPAYLPPVVELIRKEKAVILAGIYTHFAVAESAEKTYTLWQLRRYLSAVDASGGRKGIMLHAANSAATIDLPQTHLDMVRPGIAIYGYQPSDEMHTRLSLKPALRLVSRLMQVKNLPEGSRCGYGLRYTFTRGGRVGLVPIGYGDGYLRSLSDKTSVGVSGRMAPVRGAVSMDQILVDLTEVPDASVGDEVEIISPRPGAPNSLENLARLAGTIPYEILCRLGSRIRRELVEAYPGESGHTPTKAEGAPIVRSPYLTGPDGAQWTTPAY